MSIRNIRSTALRKLKTNEMLEYYFMFTIKTWSHSDVVYPPETGLYSLLKKFALFIYQGTLEPTMD